MNTILQCAHNKKNLKTISLYIIIYVSIFVNPAESSISFIMRHFLLFMHRMNPRKGLKHMGSHVDDLESLYALISHQNIEEEDETVGFFVFKNPHSCNV